METPEKCRAGTVEEFRQERFCEHETRSILNVCEHFERSRSVHGGIMQRSLLHFYQGCVFRH